MPARSLRLAHRISQATFGVTLLLIVAGGLVTNTGSALAVPDWPTTFGHNMFLYPWAEMVGGVFYEHTHRLLGSLVGLLTLALAASLWPAGGRWRLLGIVAAVAVVTQGVLGGLRVVLLQHALAIVHGCLAQAFVALLAVIMVLTGPRRDAYATREVDPALRTLAVAAAGLVYLQVVFGAFLTHSNWIALHLAGAVAVYAVLPVAGARVGRWGGDDSRRLARLLLVALVVQLALGVGSYVGRFTSVAIPAAPIIGLALPVTHRLVGSVILAGAVALAVRVAVARPRQAHASARAVVSGATS
jgi:heme a synthase